MNHKKRGRSRWRNPNRCRMCKVEWKGFGMTRVRRLPANARRKIHKESKDGD